MCLVSLTYDRIPINHHFHNCENPVQPFATLLIVSTWPCLSLPVGKQYESNVDVLNLQNTFIY
jgi:hypothetical protein